jgi:gamma-glutamylcyclotransferase (GGCT)/AIG2-like uncharacterized protein YtfP
MAKVSRRFRKPEDRPALVFVYGTLMRGKRSHKILVRLGGIYRGRGWIPGRLFISDFPRYVRADSGKVPGELYAFRDMKKTLTTLDEFEGSTYIRAGVVAFVRSKKVEAWAYESTIRPDLNTQSLSTKTVDDFDPACAAAKELER